VEADGVVMWSLVTGCVSSSSGDCCGICLRFVLSIEELPRGIIISELRCCQMFLLAIVCVLGGE